ncbi:dTDP-4-dehydrorhamnose reductase subunit, NAD(P)-binding, of dTDP-L-rhamnose synthase [Roseovarius sp. EC-HK134]|uniref:dTDP-4-dehydrorhamnose reductase n=1 Tax=unclassified Roseovarius TaxID=2614913 RepID=UPI001254E1C0|nr:MULTISPECIES: dTDP-4-dehydrorhamnose reductase [unclassified Roseovarius]VVT06102.1 dTDP-4-dehydrorhamnose reductase subunit, NAD(P)-binding, of dTDP-L-rhamnose synthase [Roseovarius sp. EC-SD190]VVT06319.1 dTDP-4-dehydrorhamnose reductase subunit, NAD(P)-binding, of dTDP-L-rhamnose synthase [Roseovarius sp. EC-HK134]
MRILVFGRTGQVATEIQRQAEVTALGRELADLSDPMACAEAIRDHAPDLVINAAAYTAVDRAESEEDLATVINGVAPGAMARACANLGIPFCHVSTDYVFDGSGAAPRAPSDPVAPCNAYGRSKLAGEEAVRAAGGQAAILRTSWVFSAHGGNFVKTMLRLSETRDALSVVDDQIGGPTPAADIAAALLSMGRAMVAGHAGGLYHFSGAPDASWADFAREIFAQAGRVTVVTGIPTRDYPTPAARPQNSRLDCGSLAAEFGIGRPDWRAGLARVLKELEQA